MENYRKAPKIYHDIKKEDLNYLGNYFLIYQRLYEIIYYKLSGKHGNQIKLIQTLLGTIGDGSFGVSEKWITHTCRFSQQRYIEARKSLIEMGWLELKDRKLIVKISNMLKDGELMDLEDAHADDVDDDKAHADSVEVILDAHAENTNPHVDNIYPHADSNEAHADSVHNIEVTYNNNINNNNNIDEAIRNINFSRTIDLKVLLRTVKETEHSIKSFIVLNNIDSADDFIYFWNKLNEEDSAFMEKSAPKNKLTVLEKYNKYLDCDKEICEEYVLEDTDIFYTGNDNKQKEINGIFFSTNPFSCVLSLDQAKILKQLQSDGLVISKYFFRRNDRNK